MEELTLMQYYNNPSGKGSAIVSGQKDTMDKYKNEVDKNSDSISLKWYKHKNKMLIAHVKIPSGSVKEIFYDVLFQFDINLSKPHDIKTLAEVPVKVFCNAPSFVYTYAYTFNKNNYIIPWLKNKYDKATLSKAPKIRNAYQVIALDKVFFSAVYFLLNGRCRYDITKNTAIDLHNLNVISNSIDSFEMLMQNYNALKSRYKLDNTNDITTVKKSLSTKTNSKARNGIGRTQKVSKVSKVSKSNKVKKI